MTTPISGQQSSFYNPVTSVYLSFFLTPALGSYFHLKNWSRLGQAQKVSCGKVWLFVSLAFLLVYSILWDEVSHATAFWSHIAFCTGW